MSCTTISSPGRTASWYAAGAGLANFFQALGLYANVTPDVALMRPLATGGYALNLPPILASVAPGHIRDMAKLLFEMLVQNPEFRGFIIQIPSDGVERLGNQEMVVDQTANVGVGATRLSTLVVTIPNVQELANAVALLSPDRHPQIRHLRIEGIDFHLSLNELLAVCAQQLPQLTELTLSPNAPFTAQNCSLTLKSWQSLGPNGLSIIINGDIDPRFEEPLRLSLLQANSSNNLSAKNGLRVERSPPRGLLLLVVIGRRHLSSKTHPRLPAELWKWLFEEFIRPIYG